MKTERTQFRPLNEDEIHLIEVCVMRNMESYRLLGFSDSSTFGEMHSEAEVLVQYGHLGSGFTVCTLLIDNQIKVGASRCSHRDRPNRIKGEMLALRRAIVSKAPPISLGNVMDADYPTSSRPLFSQDELRTIMIEDDSQVCEPRDPYEKSFTESQGEV